MEAATIEKQINNYLPQLSVKQKKAVLTVVKTFADDENTNGYSDDFKKELDSPSSWRVSSPDILQS